MARKTVFNEGKYDAFIIARILFQRASAHSIWAVMIIIYLAFISYIIQHNA